MPRLTPNPNPPHSPSPHPTYRHRALTAPSCLCTSPPDLSALLSAYPDEEDGGDRYVMGFSIVPPEVMENFAAFPPWDAFDCAHKRGAAQGITASRATLNANGRLQVLSFHNLLGPESGLTCGAAFGAEQHCLVNSRSAIDGTSP